MPNQTNKASLKSIVMIGATGAVGTQALKRLVELDDVGKITLLVRSLSAVESDKITQHVVDVLDPETYQTHLHGHDIGISTFGVGEPSKISKEDFLKIDKDAVLAFATNCKN
ncbi:NAD(P)H-binding protein [Cohaesibacter celericrescens]